MHNPHPIFIGCDTELYNAIHGENSQSEETGARAARAVLDQVEGLPRRTPIIYSPGIRPYDSYANAYGQYYHKPGYQHASISLNQGVVFNPQDCDRKYSPSNGGCNYIDLNHFETCTPEVRLAREFVAAFHANLRTAWAAAESAEGLLEGQHIVLLANNVDPYGSSYGGHMNYHISSWLWNKLVDRSPFSLLFLLTFKISSIIYTGQGRVLITKKGVPIYRVTQRGLKMKCVRGAQTTFNRPLFNERDEPLCNEARLHDIFYDTNLSEPSLYLKAGVNQLILAMLEEDYVDHNLIVDDPLYSLYIIDSDPSLQKKITLRNGKSLTAVELQILFFEKARQFVSKGLANEYVGDAEEILDYWRATLEMLRLRDFDGLSQRLDWVLKKYLIEKAMGDSSTLAWNPEEALHLDMIYSSLNPSEGIYFRALADQYVERIVSDDDIEHFRHYPPNTTRAWARANILRRVAPEDIIEVNWDEIKLRVRDQDRVSLHTIKFPHVYASTKLELETIFNECFDIKELLEKLDTFSEEINKY